MKFESWLRVFGCTDFRGACPTESVELITFFNVLRLKYPPLGRVAIHPRNEGVRAYAQTMRHKAEGMSVGAADIIIPGTSTFVCELKRKDHTKSKWEKGQQEYLQFAHNNGAYVCVALGYEQAIKSVIEWRKIVDNK